MSKRPRWIPINVWMKSRKAVKGAWDYRAHLLNEIEELKLRGPSKHLDNYGNISRGRYHNDQ